MISIITTSSQNAAQATGGDGEYAPHPGFTRGDGVWKADSGWAMTLDGGCATFCSKYGSSLATPNTADRWRNSSSSDPEVS